MFKLNQPIIKNKVLTWSRDLTIFSRIQNLKGVTMNAKISLSCWRSPPEGSPV